MARILITGDLATIAGMRPLPAHRARPAARPAGWSTSAPECTVVAPPA